MVVVPKLVNIKQTLLMDLHSVEKATKLTEFNYCCPELGANIRIRSSLEIYEYVVHLNIRIRSSLEITFMVSFTFNIISFGA